MMHKRHRQNNCIIFQCNLPSHQHICDISQKVPLFQSNRILEACCRDTTPWPAWARRRRQTAFHEDASSDVEIGRSRWVPGLVSKVDETAVQIQCPWLWLVRLEMCTSALSCMSDMSRGRRHQCVYHRIVNETMKNKFSHNGTKMFKEHLW